MNERSPAKMTQLSKVALEAATQWDQPAEDAAAALDKLTVRTFSDMLRAVAPKDTDLRETLVRGLCANDPTADRSSIDRNVRNWLSGRTQPTKREKLLELCFVLNLNVRQADTFLAVAGDTGIHWRDPREFAYAYALRKGMNWQEARSLLERVLPEAEESAQSVRALTSLMKKDARDIDSEEELRAYLAEHAGQMGEMHNSAYQYFTHLMEMATGSDLADEEACCSARDVIRDYLYAFPKDARKTAKGSDKLEGILKAWPDEFVLSRMKHRTVDVTRKVLLLLFVATDGGDEDQDVYDDPYPVHSRSARSDADAAFRSAYARINMMLTNCGFRRLDPRNAFDWVILYCIRVNNTDPVSCQPLNERLSQVLDMLFAAREDEENAPSN